MRSILTSKIRRDVGGVSVETLVLYAADASLDAHEFETVLNRELERDIWPDEILVLLRHDASDPVRAQISAKRRLEISLGRAHERIAITFSTFGPDGEEVDVYPHRGERCGLTYEDLRRRMMTEVFVRRGGFTVGLGAGFGRPKTMFVRPEALLKSEAYRERLDYAVSRAVPASVGAIIQLDDSSSALVERIKDRLRSDVRVLQSAELDGLEPDGTTNAVLIVAAVIESGRSLQDVSRELRSAFPKAPQSYLVGFSKTESAKRAQQLRNSLIKTAAVAAHELVRVESMTLPPDPALKAWSSELEFWQRLQAGGEAGQIPSGAIEVVARRVERLKDAAEPLSDELFVRNSDELPLKLEHGFVFWPEGLPTERAHTQADVFFTISSVLQNLRQSETTRVLRASNIQHTLLAAGNFGRFNDAIIQASLLRAAFPAEINYAADRTSSNEMGRIARRIIENAGRPRGGAAAEILLALATERLKLCSEDRALVLKPIEGLPPLVACLLEACRRTFDT